MDNDNDGDQAEIIKLDLSQRYGELIGGDTLRLVLGYKSLPALKHAIKANKLTLSTFFVEGRKGRFALTGDIAKWLLTQRDQLQQKYPAVQNK